MMNLKIFPGAKVTQQQKADYVEKCISREMEQQDKQSGAVNIPHFLRAADKVKEIQANGALDSEYKKYQKKGL